jgi:hypothetical protein
LPGHQVEVRRRPAYDGAECDYGVKATARRRAPRNKRQVKCAGYADELNLFFACAVPEQRIDCAAHQVLDDAVVEPRRDQRKAQVARQQIALGDFDVVHSDPQFA